MGRKRRNSKKSPVLAIVIVLIVLVGAGLFGFNMWRTHLGDAYIPGDENYIAVNIPSGSSTGKIGQILEDNGIVKSASSFKYFVRFSGYDGRLQAGDYSFCAGMDGEALVAALLDGHSNTCRFTIPEGLNVEQVASKLAAEGLVDYEAFLDEVQNGQFDYDFIEELAYDGNGYRLEGVLFPNTYDVYVDATEHDIIDRMLKEFDRVFNDDYRAKMNEEQLTLRGILDIASIVEREARIDSDRPLVSSVIYNRLAISMPLQMCSTVQYILGEQKDVLTYADIAIDNPYNTYLYAGLPPGPICSPGKASIEAALYPADTDYIYFVVSEKLDGSHNFSADYSKFERDKAAYQAALKNQ